METDQGMNEGTDGGIDQGSMESDYMSQYELVDDNGTPIVSDENDSGTPAPSDPNPAVPPQAQPENNQGATDYMKGFYKEDGSLDVQKAMELFNKPANAPVAPPASLPQQQPVMPPAVASQAQPESPVDPQAAMRENALAALRLQRHFISQGYDAETAMTLAEQKIDEHLNSFHMNSKIQKMQEDFDNRLKEFQENAKAERELAMAEPLTQKNLMAVCNKYAHGLPAETLQKAIFDANIGGSFLMDLFAISNPDKTNLVGESLNKAVNDWFIKNGAKNERFVESLAVNALNLIRSRVHPEMIKIIQNNAGQRSAQQHRNNPGPRTPQQPQAHKPAEQSQGHKDLDMFLHNVPRDVGGRVHI